VYAGAGTALLWLMLLMLLMLAFLGHGAAPTVCVVCIACWQSAEQLCVLSQLSMYLCAIAL
jgi:hypothetical protein